MKPRSLARWLSLLGVAPLMAGAALAADVNVMISAGFYGVYAELGPAFERASGRLVTTRGPSMGDSPEVLTSTVRHPEAASVLINFLASPEAAPVILKAGLTPLSSR